MKFNTMKFKVLALENRFSHATFARKIGMTPQQLYKVLKTETMPDKYFVPIVDFLGNQAVNLFDKNEIKYYADLSKENQSVSEPKQDYATNTEAVLRQRISDLEEIIKAKNELIELLQNRLQNRN